MALLTPLSIAGYESAGLLLMTSTGSMIFWVMLTNQFHKWSHLEASETPGFVAFLQKYHFILPPDHHQIHHTAPFENYYCITTGWLNWPLKKLRFFRIAERIITAVTGQVPRADDIGLKAAIAVAELEAEQPSVSAVSAPRAQQP
jgi:plasmanylethanolamine desaturase